MSNEIDYQRVKISRTRDRLGRFSKQGVKQSDVPEQCYKCKSYVHEKCDDKEECGCECALFIEGNTVEVDGS